MVNGRRARDAVLIGWVVGHAVTTAALLWRRRHPRPDLRVDEPFEPDVSVIVPAHNEAGRIGGTLASILRSDPLPREIVVVDDGSTDATAAEVTRLGSPRVTLVEQSHGGRAAALEAGMRASRGELVVRVDADSRVEPQTLRELVEPFVDPAVGAVAGSIRVPRDTSTLGACQDLEYLVVDAFKDVVAARGQTNVISGPAAAFRREAIVGLGGISRDTEAEDADLTHCLVAAGWQVRRRRDAVAWTSPPRSWRALAAQRGRWYGGNLQVLRKHWGLWRVGPPAARRTLRYTASYLIRPVRLLVSDALLISCARADARLAAAVATAHGAIFLV
ncbi:MAG: glycosyltransferase family 2 protein, partial [Actinomycetota bacterium]|nr:glycosyltransferase family 2 protein [Actinomycetota bacterium]